MKCQREPLRLQRTCDEKINENREDPVLLLSLGNLPLKAWNVILTILFSSCCLPGLRPVFNFAPSFDPQGWSYPPRFGVIPQTWRPSFCPPPVLLNIRECSPLGVKKGMNNTRRGQSPPPGPSNVVKNWHLCLRIFLANRYMVTNKVRPYKTITWGQIQERSFGRKWS
jgi:hypothetical protein